MQPKITPGVHIGRDGTPVVVETQGPDGKWYGSIPGFMTSTWWYPDGRHNLYRNHDLVKESNTNAA